MQRLTKRPSPLGASYGARALGQQRRTIYNRTAALYSSLLADKIGGDSLRNRRVLPENLPGTEYGKGAMWGSNAVTKRYVDEEFLDKFITDLSTKNKLEKVRQVMRYDARPWNIYLRVTRKGVSLKDDECARLMLWTSAIVSLEKHLGRKVHALQMGHEMYQGMHKKHRAGISTQMAFYRLCEVSRDVTTAFNHFTMYTQKHCPPIGGKEAEEEAAQTNAPLRRHFPPEALLHVLCLLRIVSKQPNDDKCEEIAQIVRNLYENQGFSHFGALSQMPRTTAHRERLVAASAAGGEGGINGAVAPSLARKHSICLGGASASLHCQHLEVFSLLQSMRHRIELVAKLDPEADASVLQWLDDCCEALGLSHPSNNSNNGAATSSSHNTHVQHIQTGRWILNAADLTQQRLPNQSLVFPHLEGALGPLADESGLGVSSHGPYGACGLAATSPTGGAATSSRLVLDPPSWDRPYLKDSLMRDDVIEQLEGLAFSFVTTSTQHEDANEKKPLVVSNAQLQRVLDNTPAPKRLALLTDLVSRVKKQFATQSEQYEAWVAEATHTTTGTAAAEAVEGIDKSNIVGIVQKKSLEEEKQRHAKAGGSMRLFNKRQWQEMKARSTNRLPIPAPIYESGVWRLPAAPIDGDAPTLFLQAIEKAAGDGKTADGAAVVDATEILQKRKSAMKSAAGGSTRGILAGDQNLSVFLNSVAACGQLTSEVYHYLLVALAHYAPSSAASLLEKLQASNVAILDMTRAPLMAAFAQQHFRQLLGASSSSASEKDGATSSPKDALTSNTASTITNRIADAFNKPKSSFGTAVSLFKEQLAAMKDRAAFDRDHDVTRAAQAYWSYNYPQLLEYRNAFESKLAFYRFVLPAIGVNALLDIVVASEQHRSVVSKHYVEGSSAANDANVPLVSEEALVEIRNSLPIVDTELAEAIASYLVDVLGGKQPLVDNDVVTVPSSTSSSSSANSNQQQHTVVDAVLNLITTQLPKLDIALVGAVPHFDTYALSSGGFTDEPAAKKKGPRGAVALGDESARLSTNPKMAEIATSLADLKERINSVHGGANSSSGSGATSIQPIYLLDASFLENKEHVSTLLGIIGSHRRKGGNVSGAGGEVTSPPILLVPYSSLADLSKTASGAGRDVFMDAGVVLSGTTGSADDVSARLLRAEDDVAMQMGSASKFDAPSEEMRSALEALGGVAKLVARVPKSVMVLHFTEMCMAYHSSSSSNNTVNAGANAQQNNTTIANENGDVWLLRMAAVLAALGGGNSGGGANVKYNVHLCTDDPLFVTRVKDEAPLRQLANNVHFLSTSPLVSGLLKAETRPIEDKAAAATTTTDAAAAVEVEVVKPQFYFQKDEGDTVQSNNTTNGNATTTGDTATAATTSADDADLERHKHASLWGADCDDILASIPIDGNFEANLEDRPTAPVSAEEMAADAAKDAEEMLRLKHLKEGSRSSAGGHAGAVSVSSSKPLSDATAVEFSADSWAEMLDMDGDDDLSAANALLEAAAGDDEAAVAAAPTTAGAASATTTAALTDDGSIDPSELMGLTFDHDVPLFSPQDIRPAGVKVLGDVSAERQAADDLLSELLQSNDEEGAELAKAFLRRLAEEEKVRNEMAVNQNSSAAHDLLGPDQGAMFYSGFGSSRAIPAGEMLTLEQQNHVNLQRAYQKGGVKALRRELSKMRDADKHSKPVMKDIIGGPGSEGPTSNVSLTKADDKRIEREERRKIRRDSVRWSNNAIMQDHLANTSLNGAERTQAIRDVSSQSRAAVDPRRFQVYEANINDPRNAHLVEAYRLKQRSVVGKAIGRHIRKDAEERAKGDREQYDDDDMDPAMKRH